MNDSPPVVCGSISLEAKSCLVKTLPCVFCSSSPWTFLGPHFFCKCCIRKSDPSAAKTAWIKCKLTKIDPSVAIAKLLLVPKGSVFQPPKVLYATLNSADYKYPCHIIRTRFGISEYIEHSGMVILVLCTTECLPNLNLMLGHSIT